MAADKITILSRVKLKDLNRNLEVEYTLVSPQESDSRENRISTASPVGKALLGRKIGDVVEIVEDCISDLGAEDNDTFLSVFDLGLLNPDSTPYINGKLINNDKTGSKVLETLPKVNGITVNTVHGNSQSIEQVRSLFSPVTESMEGAAFFYACLLDGIPCVQLRAVSNFIEVREKSNWDIEKAVKNLNTVLSDFIQEQSC